MSNPQTLTNTPTVPVPTSPSPEQVVNSYKLIAQTLNMGVSDGLFKTTQDVRLVQVAMDNLAHAVNEFQKNHSQSPANPQEEVEVVKPTGQVVKH